MLSKVKRVIGKKAEREIPTMMQLSSAYKNVSFEQECPLFKNMNEYERRKLSQSSRLKVLSKQQNLFMQHSSSDRLFNIASGVGTVERISSNGRRQILAFIFPGDFVGLSHSSHYEYGVKSLSGMTAYEFKRNTLFTLSEELPTLKNNLREIRSLVLALTLEQVYLLGQLKAYERVCFMLKQLLQRIPGARPDRIELPMTRVDIADYLGLTVETVSRSLSQLKRDGVISTLSPNAIQILKMDAVEEFADIE